MLKSKKDMKKIFKDIDNIFELIDDLETDKITIKEAEIQAKKIIKTLENHKNNLDIKK